MRICVSVALLAALTSSPAAASTWRGAARLEAGDPAGALKDLARARGRSAHYLRGRALEALGRPAQAERHYVRARRSLRALDDEIAVRRARMLVAAGRPQRARRVLLRFLRRYRERPTAYRRQAVETAVRAQTGRKRCRAAERMLKKLTRIYELERPTSSLFELATCFERTGDRSEAAVRYEEIALYRRRSRSAPKAGAALTRLRRLGVEPPQGSFGREASAVAALRRAKRLEEAQKRLARLKPEGRYQHMRRDLERAQLLHARGRHREAARAYRALFDRRPRANWSEGYARLAARCLREVGDRVGEAEALLAADRGSRRSRREGRDLWRAGIALEHAGEPERASKLFLHLSRRNRRHRDASRAYLRAITVLVEQGRFSRAAKIARKIPRRLRRSARRRARWLHAWALLRGGDAKGAARSLRRIDRRRRGPDRERRRARYWLARLAEVEERARAVRGYRALVEASPHSFYADLALARLAALGVKAAPPVGRKRRPPRSFAPTKRSRRHVAESHRPSRPSRRLRRALGRLARRYGKDVPGFARAAAFYRLGLVVQTRRELLAAQRTVEDARLRPRRRYAFTTHDRVNLRRWERKRRRRLAGVDRARLALRLAGLFEGLGDPAQAEENRRRFARAIEGRRKRGRPEYPRYYSDLVREASARHGIDPAVLFAIIRQESAFRTDALSDMGARGLMQIIPSTARRIAKRLGARIELRLLDDPALSLHFGAWYLRQLLDKYRGQLPLAIASYNAGPRRVSEWLDLRGRLPLDVFLEEIPFKETRRYVRKVISSARAYAALLGSLAGAYATASINPKYGDNINF